MKHFERQLFKKPIVVNSQITFNFTCKGKKRIRMATEFMIFFYISRLHTHTHTHTHTHLIRDKFERKSRFCLHRFFHPMHFKKIMEWNTQEIRIAMEYTLFFILIFVHLVCFYFFVGNYKCVEECIILGVRLVDIIEAQLRFPLKPLVIIVL